MTLAELNALAPEDAARRLLDCCGATRWANLMAGARPFSSAAAVAAAADVIWSSLDRADWLEAFRAHPKIGETTDAAGESSRWSTDEQHGVALADAGVRSRLADVNRAYEARFGYIFIVCAATRSADEMLAAAERRLHHDEDTELHVAAEEQRRITQLRLARLIAR